MKKLILFGTTQFSRIIARHIEQEGVGEVLVFCVNEQFLTEEQIGSKRVVAFEKLNEYFDMNTCEVLNTLGYSKMNETRKKVTEQCVSAGYKMFSYISKNAQVYCDIEGCNNIVMPGAFVGFDVKMGNNNVVYSGCMLTHDITMGDNNFLGANSTFGGNVKIGNNCFVGLNATVKNGIKLGNKCLIGAGAYINKDVEDEKVVVPAKHVILDKKSEEFI